MSLSYSEKNAIVQQQKLEQSRAASIYPIKYIDALDCSSVEYQNEFTDQFDPIIPPFSNTGGTKQTVIKTTVCSLTPTIEKFSCIVDFLSFSFALESDFSIENFTSSLDNVEKIILELSGHVGGLAWAFQDKGLFGYKYSATLARHGQNVGLVGFGGNNNSCYVSLSGQGCVGVDMFNLKKFVENLPACKITRIDLAHDDLECKQSIHDYRALYESGGFAMHNTNPSARFIDDMGTGKGSTLYVGAKRNGKEACIYEKGKQLGSQDSPWIRFEGRLTAVDRVVSFDAMVNPAQYLAALYPPFAHLSAIHARLVIIKNHTKIALDHLVEYASIAYGRLVNYLKVQGKTDAQIVEMLIVDGIPKRLMIPVTEEINMIPF